MRFIIVSTVLSIARAATAGPTVDTYSGRVKGFSPAPGVTAFLGIPFAAPPVGALRFAPPRQFPAGAYKDTIDGTKFSASCWQFQYKTPFAVEDSQAFQGEQSEDCLKLNVWTPTTAVTNKKKKGKLPVMVWIHGGGFGEGTAMAECMIIPTPSRCEVLRCCVGAIRSPVFSVLIEYVQPMTVNTLSPLTRM